MAESAEATVQQMFERWRRGDADAGRVMAQRFSDWYYAITAVRLGDRKGRAPLDRSCQAFAAGIVNVTRPGDLVEWAYALVQQEVAAAGGHVSGGDIPNAITRNRSPSRLLRQVRGELDDAQLKLLHLVYSGRGAPSEIEQLAEGQGGMPMAALRARYTLKRLLKQQADVSFQETPMEIDFDRGPLPLYEANALANADEVVALEKWLLGDAAACRDAAEFAAFAVALRGGALTSEDAADPVETTRTAPVSQDAVTSPRRAPLDEQPNVPAPQPRSLVPIIAVVVVLVVLLIIAVVVLKG